MDPIHALIEGRNLFFRRSIYQVRHGREQIVRLYLENERHILQALYRETIRQPPVTINIPIQAPANFFDPVPVFPTVEQIDSVLRSVQPGEGTVCAICQDAVTSACVEIHPCLHRFHGACIRQWFETSVRCPVCRHDIRTDQEDQTSVASTETPPRVENQWGGSLNVGIEYETPY